MERFTLKAKKYLFALGGVGILIAAQHYNIVIPGLPDIVSEMLMGLLVAEGVYQARNVS
jgi:hypothetical protein